ncbi:MAG TPA: hypothetical protein VGP72_03845 [Planctomycetota bacterium]|jgi:hypothetical protein
MANTATKELNRHIVRLFGRKDFSRATNDENTTDEDYEQRKVRRIRRHEKKRDDILAQLKRLPHTVIRRLLEERITRVLKRAENSIFPDPQTVLLPIRRAKLDLLVQQAKWLLHVATLPEAVTRGTIEAALYNVLDNPANETARGTLRAALHALRDASKMPPRRLAKPVLTVKQAWPWRQNTRELDELAERLAPMVNISKSRIKHWSNDYDWRGHAPRPDNRAVAVEKTRVITTLQEMGYIVRKRKTVFDAPRENLTFQRIKPSTIQHDSHR